MGEEIEQPGATPHGGAEAEPSGSPDSGLQPCPGGVAVGLGPLLEAVHVPVLLARGDRVLTLNRAFASLFATAGAHPLPGTSLSGVLETCALGEKAKQAVLLWLVQAKAVPVATSEPVLVARPDGAVELVHFTSTQAKIAGEETVVITIEPSGLSPAKAPEGATAAAERLASVAKLAFGAAQAINNPLLYVASNVTYSSERLSYVSDLLDDSSPMQVKDPRTLRGLLLPVLEALGEAHLGATRASRLVRDLRSLIDLDTVPTPVDLSVALEAAINLAEGEVALRAHLRTNLLAEGFVLASTTRLTQLLLGLIVASAQGLESGKPQKYRIDVRSWTEGEFVLISVQDNAAAGEPGTGESGPIEGPSGGGSVADARARRAEAFDVCARLARHLGGALEAQSSALAGSSATLRLPLTSSSRKQRGTSVSPVRPGRRTRVLVVDNEPLIVRALARLLRADHDVETASGGYEALDLIRHDGPFDLVLCDLGMPEMNGLELFAQATRLAAEMGPRFVFVTGGIQDEQVQTTLDALPNHVLDKPIQPALLRQVVSQLLGTGAERPRPD